MICKGAALIADAQFASASMPRRPKGPCGCLMDRAGWHTRQLKVPKNLTIISAAIARSGTEPKYLAVACAPLSNRVFDYNAIVDAGCEAWNKLIAQLAVKYIRREAVFYL